MAQGLVEDAIPDLPVVTQGIYAVYPPGRFTQPKVRAFIDFLVFCALEDDGSFTVPADVADLIDDNPYELVSRLTRRYQSLDLIDGISFFQSSGVGE